MSPTHEQQPTVFSETPPPIFIDLSVCCGDTHPAHVFTSDAWTFDDYAAQHSEWRAAMIEKGMLHE